MFSEELKAELTRTVQNSEHPRELLVDIIFKIQDRYGYLDDESLEVVARLLHMDPLEIEQIATFYTFIFREPVGKYVIHVCDSVMCWSMGGEALKEFLCRSLDIQMGETTPDGLFTLLPVCCIGYCDRSPAILVNKKVYGNLTPEKLERLLDELRFEAQQERTASQDQAPERPV
ncbi:MAG: NADH-quinone oxidoreductase subunit NuoE [Deltaproteobacteria bacterium]|nr:NADH-quinone oxidoreductase subunit NuoE [Deltaproteobacteria bacterium]